MIRDSIILGVDPGYGRVGIAVIESREGKQTLIHSECFETSPKLPHPKRLVLIAEKMEGVLEKYKPSQVAVEELLFSKNVKTAIKVAEARGIILAIAAKNNPRVLEFNPNSVKLAVTGYGRADKKQIVAMLHKILKIKKTIKHDDEYDAIAVGLTCAYVPLSTERV